MTTVATQFEGIRSVSGSTERDLLFPSPATYQKVYNRSSRAIEEWTGTAWQPIVVVNAFHVDNFGAVGDGVTDDTAAIQSAMQAASNLGGGTVLLGAHTYKVSQLTFDNLSNVILMGAGSGFNYIGDHLPASLLSVTTGVWGIRIPPTSSHCQVINLGLVSIGVLNGTVPHVATIDGVEYGLLVETGSTIVRGVVCAAFMYGCVLSAGGNSNVFEECTFVSNTRAGFACTSGSAGAYAAYHPNLVVPAGVTSTTVYTLRNCAIRRNAWGMIIREGDGIFSNLVVESNYFGGLYEYVGSLDSGISGTWYSCYFEGNWSDFDVAAVYTINQNRLLQETLGVWVPWILNANTALSDAGYQIFMGSQAMTATSGPAGQQFINLQLHCSTSGPTQGKGLYIKAAFITKFYGGTSQSGDTANAIRLAATSTASAAHFYDFQATPPAAWSNRCVWMTVERSDADALGGLTMVQGYFRGLFGPLKFPATEALSADAKTLDAYEEIVGASAACTGAITTASTWKLTKVGNVVTLVLPAISGVATAATNFQYGTVIPARFRPAATVGAVIQVKDNAGLPTTPGMVFVSSAGGQIAVYRDVSNAVNFTAAAAAGLSSDVTISWTL